MFVERREQHYPRDSGVVVLGPVSNLVPVLMIAVVSLKGAGAERVAGFETKIITELD